MINENNNYNWFESPKDISKSDQVNLIWALDDINKYQTLKKINDDITKIVFGKILMLILNTLCINQNPYQKI